MTARALDALARRANQAGHPSIAEYCRALELQLERLLPITANLAVEHGDAGDREMVQSAVAAAHVLLGDDPTA
jgi:hypothetical protein